MRTVYLDGKFVKEQDAKLSIYDLSVMQAAFRPPLDVKVIEYVRRKKLGFAAYT